MITPISTPTVLTPSHRPRDVQTAPLAPQITMLRSRSWQRLRFELEYALQKGTTANSYLIQAERTALIDPPGETFTPIYLETLQQLLDLNTLDYLILGHINVNRAATLKALLEINPRLTIICSNPAAITLRALFPDTPLTIAVVRGQEHLDLGQGHQLQFSVTPTPRWPDHLCTYDPVSQILFSDKLFGCHVCGDSLLDENRSALFGDQQHYFQCVFTHSIPQVETLVERLSTLPMAIVAPNHGPVLRYGVRQMIQFYRIWSQAQRVQTLSVVLLYASAYGNTAAMAQGIARGLAAADIGVDLINCETATPTEIQQAVERADGILLGSPTLGGHVPTQMQTACGIVLAQGGRHQWVGVFGSYGWSGEAVNELATKLQEAGFRLGCPPLRIKFKPTTEILQLCEKTGQQFARSLRQSRRLILTPTAPLQEKEPRSWSASTDRREQSLGRLIGSLCVLTVKRGEVTGALLSSWVTQASFSPPGLSIAIPQQHSISELLKVGEPFTLNILQEGKQVRKHFQRVLSPGEDRFKDLEILEADADQIILKEALAYLVCRVGSRIECGDHWVIYGVVETGQVLNRQGRTAVLHRQSSLPIEPFSLI